MHLWFVFCVDKSDDYHRKTNFTLALTYHSSYFIHHNWNYLFHVWQYNDWQMALWNGALLLFTCIDAFSINIYHTRKSLRSMLRYAVSHCLFWISVLRKKKKKTVCYEWLKKVKKKNSPSIESRSYYMWKNRNKVVGMYMSTWVNIQYNIMFT